MRPSITILIFSLAFAFGCNYQTTAVSPALKAKERFYCDSLKIDTSLVVSLRTQTDSTLIPFPANLENILDKDIDSDSNRKNYPGFIFNASHTESRNIVINLCDDIQKKGYTIFLLVDNSGVGSKPDIVGVLKTVDKYEILRQVQTDGINSEIDNDSLLNVIRRFDKKYSLQLIGASEDWCEFKIHKAPQNWVILAKEAYKVCPDIVDQGTGTIEKLADEMKRTKRLYFWWD